MCPLGLFAGSLTPKATNGSTTSEIVTLLKESDDAIAKDKNEGTGLVNI